MTEKAIEWNLGFARDEVVTGLEKFLAEGKYTYTQAETDARVDFHVALSSGSLTLTVRPLLSHRSPFSPKIILHRTLLLVTFVGVSDQEKETFLHRLTLTFLRVGG